MDAMIEAKAKELTLLEYRQWIIDGFRGPGPRQRRVAELAGKKRAQEAAEEAAAAVVAAAAEDDSLGLDDDDDTSSDADTESG